MNAVRLLVASTLIPLSACSSEKVPSTSDGAADDTAGEAGSITYHEHVEPILAQHCTRCHHEGGLGPGDFTDPGVVAALAPAMLAAIDAGEMPPPASDPACRDYRGSDVLFLGDESRDVISAWIDGGKPLGEPVTEERNTPAASPELADPDLVLMMEHAYTPTYEDPANPGNEYRCFLLDPGEDRETLYLTAMAPVIDQEAIAHHAVLFTLPRDEVPEDLKRPEGMDCIEDLSDASLSGMVGAWAPGMLPIELPEGTGMPLPPNEVLVLQMHYFYSGSDTEGVADRSGYAFRTAPSVTKQAQMAPLGAYNFRIPADDPAYTHESSFYNEYIPINVLGMFPHMHVLGKSYQARIRHADGSETCLVEGDYDFANQMTYQFNESVRIEVGDTIEFSCTWDNSTGNPDRILDEPKTTYYGERTDEEMCFFFSLVTL